MKLTTGILLLVVASGTALGQNPNVIDNTRSTMKAVEQKKQTDSNAALAASQGQAANPSTAAGSNVAVKPAPSKPTAATAKPKVTVAPQVKAAKPAPSRITAAKQPAKPKQPLAVEDKKNPAEAKKDEPKTINLTGRRDPFLSPVVNRSMVGSGCSTGKRCLAIDQINLKGVVKSENGMIAVVVNALDKAYFLRENDPVFNGYVVRITGDSIIFKETIQDKLGKPFVREVTKKITTPAV